MYRPPDSVGDYLTCCRHGTIDIRPLPPPTGYLHDLWTTNDGPGAHMFGSSPFVLTPAGAPAARHFRSHVRFYNNALAFTSVGAKVDASLIRGGVPLYKIQGALVHHLGSLLPPDGESPVFLQVYISDTTLADKTTRRANLANNVQSANPADNIRPLILQRLTEHIHVVHPLAQTLLNAQQRLAELPGHQVLNLILRTIQPHETDPRRYNLPRGEEVAMIVVKGRNEVASAGSGQGQSRDVIIQHKVHGLRRITEKSDSYLASHYVLLFSHGSSGWTPNIPFGKFHLHNADVSTPTSKSESAHELADSTEIKFVSLAQWHAYHLYTRRSPYISPLHVGHALFQQYLVDAYSTIEEDRLNYHRKNQQQLRTESHDDLEAAVEDGEDMENVGTRTILPSTFVGGPRYMHANYQDCMAIVRKCGPPSFFVTFTSNPRWKEILDELEYGQSASDRPDLVARVFRLKLNALRRELITEGAFGVVVGNVYVVEYQTRGLPHAHLLLIMHPEYRPRNADDFDDIICAELPDPVTQPLLHATIVNTMLHGPCGAANPNCPCMVNGYCKNHYPKAFSETTSVPESGYPEYRRRNDGRTHTRGGHVFDNRHVVPYNPYLSQRYDAHINVEIASQITAVKYLFKVCFSALR
jgi:hypothetical protein